MPNGKKAKFEEIEVERINIVERDGTLRMAIHNKERVPDAVVNGMKFKREGSQSAGMIFYNNEGSECGGLSFSGREQDGQADAGAAILFDKYNHDQIVGLMYQDAEGRREYGLHVLERPDAPMWTREGMVGDHRRMFVGLNSDGDTLVLLRDSQGRPRIRMLVDANDVPKLEFLDENGEVAYSLPPAPSR